MAVKVGIIRDERYLEHKPGHIHPEHPGRLKAVYRMLDRDFQEGLIKIEPEPASLELIELVHTPAYIKKVLKTAEHNYTSLAPDTPVSSKSYLAAWLAVGGCLKGLDALISGECDFCFSMVRPPGHHALPERAGGFCIFNNMGITAKYAGRHYGLRRILIIDWDIHHGNGLNDLFYEDKNVLYFSSHDPLLYPYSGDWSMTGSGEGEGYTINIPLPREFTDEEIFHLYKEILGPVFKRYRPELILVDAGFDAHKDDPIGRSMLTEQAFRRLTELLLELRSPLDHPPVLFALEGGYNPGALARSVKEVLMVLTGRNEKEAIPAGMTLQVERILKKVSHIHAKHKVWAN